MPDEASSADLGQDASDPSQLFAALADDTRRQVVELLAAGPRRAGELAHLTTVSPPVMSRHLRILLRIGIIDDERSPVDARVRLFYLRREALAPLASWLERTQTHWSHELASF